MFRLFGMFKGRILSSIVMLAAGLGFPPAQAQDAYQADIAGLRLGMTEAEVRAALQDFDSTLRIESVMGYFTYSDGVNYSLHTPEFLDRVEAKPPQAYSTSFTVYFSGPPGEPRVVLIHRSTASNAPPTAAQYEAGLFEKYGLPTARLVANRLLWEEPGKPQCMRELDYKRELQPSVPSSLSRDSALQLLEARQRNRANNKLPDDLTTCGAYLYYDRAGLDPVLRFTAELIDLGAIAASEYGSSEWVEGLIAEAVSKREAQAVTPKF